MSTESQPVMKAAETSNPLDSYVQGGSKFRLNLLLEAHELLSRQQMMKASFTIQEVLHTLYLSGGNINDSELNAHTALLYESSLQPSNNDHGDLQLHFPRDLVGNDITFLRGICSFLLQHYPMNKPPALTEFLNETKVYLMGRERSLHSSNEGSSHLRGKTSRGGSGYDYYHHHTPNHHSQYQSNKRSGSGYMRGPNARIDMEKSEPIVRLLAQVRKVGMDILFPQSCHDKILACIFVAVRMAAAPHAHRELIDMVMAVKESGRVTQLENVSKTKVRGVLALLKHGELLITQGVDGEPVRLFLSRGIDNFGSLRTLHDDFLLRYIAEHHIFIPDVLKAELIWTFSEPERRERLQLMNTFVQQVELFFQEYTYQSTTSSVSSYGKQQNESSSRYSFSFPKSSGDYVESDYGSLHSGYSGISEERSFGVFDFPDLVRGGSNDFNQLCSTSHSSIASLTDERPFGSEMPWGEGLDFLNKDKHQNVSGSKGDVSSSYNFSKNIEENFHWKPSTENEIDFADKSIADSITSLGLGEEDYLSDTGSGRHSSTSRPSQSSEVSATVDLGTLPNAFGNFSLGDGSIYQRSKSSDDKYPQRTAINALPKAVGSIRKQTAYDYDPRNGNSNIFQESYDYDDQHFGMASKEYYPTSYLRNSYLPREPVPPNGYQSHAVRKDKLPSYVHIGKQTTGGYYQPQQTHGQNRSSVELSGGENFSFQSKPAQLEKAANRKSFITRQSNDNWTGYGSVSNHTAVGDLGKNGLGPVDMSTYQDDTYLKSGRDAYHFSGFN